jgi:hypothetical protein
MANRAALLLAACLLCAHAAKVVDINKYKVEAKAAQKQQNHLRVRAANRQHAPAKAAAAATTAAIRAKQRRKEEQEAPYEGEDPCNHASMGSGCESAAEGGMDLGGGDDSGNQGGGGSSSGSSSGSNSAPECDGSNSENCIRTKLKQSEIPFSRVRSGTDDYWVRQAKAGRTKQRVVVQPPADELTTTTNSKGKAERTWKLSTKQRHVHFKQGDAYNPFCHQGEDWESGEQNGGGRCSWFMVQEFLDISELPPTQIIGWKADMMRSKKHFPTSPDGTIVHHMDLFPCTAAVDDHYPPVTQVEPRLWAGSDVHASCDQVLLLATY